VPPFPATICVAPNDVICHGIPNDTPLKNGDIIGIDIGAKLNGWYGDSCVTFAVGTLSPEAEKLMKVAEECMWLGIKAAKANGRLGDIGAVIQEHAESHGYSVVRDWNGHGVGQRLHEDPSVSHYGKAGTGVRLRPGMIFTVEPMINAGGYDSVTDRRDKWTVRTVDGSLSAQFEHVIAVTEHGEPEILTLP
jgi:methionyl aminopeptidase